MKRIGKLGLGIPGDCGLQVVAAGPLTPGSGEGVAIRRPTLGVIPMRWPRCWE